MDIKSFFKLIFFPCLWLFKVIKEYHFKTREHDLANKKMVVQESEAQKQREHEQVLKDKDNAIRKLEAEEKTKQLAMVIAHNEKLSEQKLNSQNPNSITSLARMRKNKKGRKSK